MKKQKVKLLIMATILVLSMIGCAKEEETVSTEPTTTVGTETEVATVETTPIETEIETIPTETETIESEPTIADELPTAIQEMDKTMYTTQSCKVRDLPKTNGVEKGSLAKNQEVHVIGQDIESQWYLLEDGYFVSNKHVTEVAPKPTESTTTPSTTKPSTTKPSETKPSATTPSTTTPSTTTPSSTVPSTPVVDVPSTPVSTACQHKNVNAVHIGDGSVDYNGCFQKAKDYQDVCADCGVVLRRYNVLGEIKHSIKETIIFDQNWICGSQDEYTHIHYQCDCGEINYDGPSELSRSKEHSLVPYQIYDADGNLCEGEACRFCPYRGETHIVEYAPEE